MKRILVLSLALILAVSSLAVPTYATETNNSSMINMLTGVQYDFYKDGVKQHSSFSPNVDTWVSKAKNAAWVWSDLPVDRYGALILTIYVTSVPDHVYYDDLDGNLVECFLWGSEQVSSGYHLQYKVTGFDPSGTVRITAAWNNSYSGNFGIISCFGYLDDCVTFTNVSYFANALLFDNGGGEYEPPQEDDFLFPHSVANVNNASLPVTVDFSGPTGSQFYTLDYGEVFLKLPFTNTLKFFDSVTYLVYTSGKILSAGARLEGSDGSVIDGLSIDIEYCGETQMIFELHENFQRLQCYVITVDVKGHNLENKLLTLQADIESVMGSFVYEYDRGFYFQCSSIVGKYDVNDVPWYSYFGLWLNEVLAANNNSLISVISSGFNRLAELLGASGDSDQFQDNVDDQGDRLDQMDDALSSVTKPALDHVDTNISGIVSDADLANTGHVYTYIIDDNIMAPALTMVSILAMMSFALFGKR